MGREIRRVPANWKHPQYTSDTAPRSNLIDEFIPLMDGYDNALAEFQADINKMGLGKALDYHSCGPLSSSYVQYNGAPATWYQLYETVSDGTPLTPPFATPEELINHLVTVGDTWSRAPWPRANAEAMLAQGWAPSGIVIGNKFYDSIESLTIPK